MAQRVVNIIRKNKETPTVVGVKKRVAAYCRVSTLSEEQEQSYESQCEYYKTFISSSPNMELVDIYADHGLSGLRAEKRPDFMRMINDAMNGMIDVIYTKSISRFSRNARECLSYVNQLKNKGVKIIFERESIDSDDPQFELVLNLLVAVAQEESNSISQTIKWAYERNNELGTPVRACCYGYMKEKKGDRKWVINESEAERIRLLFQLADEGLPSRAIAKRLNLYEQEHGFTKKWKAAIVRYALQNEAYKGDLLTNKTYSLDYTTKKVVLNNGERPQVYLEDHHEAIIPRELFDRVNAMSMGA